MGNACRKKSKAIDPSDAPPEEKTEPTVPEEESEPLDVYEKQSAVSDEPAPAAKKDTIPPKRESIISAVLPAPAPKVKVYREPIKLTHKPQKVGWSAVDGMLCYRILIDIVGGEKLMEQFEKYPKLGLVHYNCSLETTPIEYKGSQKIMMTFKHPENDFKSLEQSVRNFYTNKILAHPELKHQFTLGMDFFNPQIEFYDYLERAEQFANNERIDVYHDYPGERMPFPELEDHTPGFIEPLTDANYASLPRASRRTPGWHMDEDNKPCYILLIKRNESILKLLCDPKYKKSLVHKCNGKVYKAVYNGDNVIALKITHPDSSFRCIDGAVRVLQKFGFMDLPAHFIYTHRYLMTSGFDKKYCEWVLGIKESPPQKTQRKRAQKGDEVEEKNEESDVNENKDESDTLEQTDDSVSTTSNTDKKKKKKKRW